MKSDVKDFDESEFQQEKRKSFLQVLVGVTKQAVQVLVERVPDPADGRAKLIRWSERGRDSLVVGVGFLGQLEEELADVVGRESIADARASLLDIVDYLQTKRNGTGTPVSWVPRSTETSP